MNYNRLFLLLKFANKEGAFNALRPHLNFSEEENNSIIAALQDFSDKEVTKIVGAILRELKNNSSITPTDIIDLINSKRKVVVDSTILPLETPSKKESPLGSLLSENTDKDSILQYVSNLSSELIKLAEGLVIKDTTISMSNLTEIIEFVKSLPGKYQKWVVSRFGSNANKEELHPIKDCLPVVKDYAESEQGILNKSSENEDFNKKIQELLGDTSINNLDLLSSDDMVNILNIYRTADLTLTATKIKQLTTLPLEDKVGEAGEWEVWLPSTRENSCAIARVDKKLDPKTTWCTARTKSSNLFYSYVGLSGGNMILFYIIKKNPEPKPKTPEEDNDWISIGYYDGKRIYRGDGRESVNRSNKGIKDDRHLMKILGNDYSTIVTMMDQKYKELDGVSPALIKVQEAARDVNLYLEMVKGNSESERSDLDDAILEIPPSKEVLDKIIETGAEKSLSAIARSRVATEDILNKILEKLEKLNYQNSESDQSVFFDIAKSTAATEDILNKILERSHDENGHIFTAIAGNAAVTENILNKILKKPKDENLLCTIAQSEAVTEDMLNEIVQESNDKATLYAVAFSEAVTESILIEILEKTDNKDILSYIARSKVVTENILNKIVKKTYDRDVFITVILSKAITENILIAILEKTDNEDVLIEIIFSKAATENILNKILREKNDTGTLISIIDSRAVTENILNNILNKILNEISEKSDERSGREYELILRAIAKSKAVTENILNKILNSTDTEKVLNVVHDKLLEIKNQRKTARLLAKVNFFYKLAIAL